MTETIPSTDLFWIVDSRTGARKLLDVEALDIVRVEKTVAVETARAEPVTAKPARPEPARRLAAPRAARREPHTVWFSNA
ncbi:hypothetical protein JOE40_002319 [Arthrobacter sp. PvP102]|uniref:hypothetical protein n=1 Tax=unclassified Arthrobacter TaxID=235627 RepID=UPI001B45AD03|nr:MULTISPECIES: hypothetical protein [unclassified Arthrobacter]MBP1232675.1 hypothetical protein [Arthrobacter sp. PvP103]MBP1237810.1 hypothetical protein [Arthrobacter sp. PvP102]